MTSIEIAQWTVVCGTLFATGCGGNSTAELVTQLSDSNPEVRRSAARVFAQRDTADVIAALGNASWDADVEVRQIAISALGQRGSAAESSLSTMNQALNDPERSVRVAAALAIQKIDPGSEAYVRVLLESLRAGHGPIFLEVGQMGAEAKWAVPTLVELLSHRQATIRALAAQTLGQIGTAEADAEAALKRSLRDASPLVRGAAQKAIQRIQLQPAANRSK